MNLNNNDDGDITARVNALGSTVETLQETVSQTTDDQTENGGGNNNSEGNKMVETMHIMEMVVETIDLISATLAAVKEGVDHYLI